MIKEEDGEYKIYDYTPGIFTSSVTVGSVIKGASHIVGYNTGALKIGEKRYDTCVKLAATPLKCSWKSLGNLNDLTALKYSSNTYQFYTAMKVAGYKYVYNGAFSLKEDTFATYRNTFKEFGLGVLTGIDLPNESSGLAGKNDTAGLLLDFSIGQYDTYTPLQLAQYISTIANNGSRMQLHLLDKIVSSQDQSTLLQYEPTVLNTVTTKEEYLKRVQEGFKEVLEVGGTGYNYISSKYKPAGKTGTSQSFVDSDNDGKIDKETLSHTFAAYAPYDDPEVSFVVVSPNVYYSKNNSTYTSGVNKRITKKISDAYFELYNQS
jgi:cell division protein FtsI/penicillin-binding protein 2